MHVFQNFRSGRGCRYGDRLAVCRSRAGDAHAGAEFPGHLQGSTTTTTDMQITLPDQTGGNRTPERPFVDGLDQRHPQDRRMEYATIAIDTLNATPAGAATPSDAPGLRCQPGAGDHHDAGDDHQFDVDRGLDVHHRHDDHQHHDDDEFRMTATGPTATPVRRR